MDLALNPSKVSFGRHETFPLRYSWLTKGFQALAKDPSVFSSEDMTVTLGVGKNMVYAIRFWLLASRLIENRGGVLQPTKMGNLIFGEEGCDPYLEDEATLWLVHWLIASNPEQATAWYWFFNRFHKPDFTSVEVSTALSEFAKTTIRTKTAETTLKQEASILMRMYARSKGNTRTPLEEALDSPLSLLRLISQTPGGRIFYSRPEDREGLPLGILGFALSELFEGMAVVQMPVENLMYPKNGYPAPGAVFRLTENSLITKLERLIHLMPEFFEIRETAGIHQVYQLKKVTPLYFLKHHYMDQLRDKAA